jgi:hypothetical protein
MDGNLIVGSHQVYFGENGTIEKLVGAIMNMPDGVVGKNGTGVEGSVADRCVHASSGVTNVGCRCSKHITITEFSLLL